MLTLGLEGPPLSRSQHGHQIRAKPLNFCVAPIRAGYATVGIFVSISKNFLGHLHLICPSAQLYSVNHAGMVCRDRYPTLLPDSQLFLTTRSFPAPLSRYSFAFVGLRTLFLSCLSFPRSNPLFSTICRLFSQNTGGVG